MPDNSFYYYAAYGALVALFASYTISIRLRRNAVARKRATAEKIK
jgi:hypothetical protein